MKPILAALLLLPFISIAQDEIKTDRPDQTETTAITSKGHFQMESGFIHNQTESNARTLTLPETLLKFGINNNVELRVITRIINDKANDSISIGLEPITVGIKIKLWDEKSRIPSASFIAQMQLPNVASKDFKIPNPAPQLRLLFQNTLTPKLDVGYNIAAEWDGTTPQPVYEYTFSPNFKINNKLKAFVETYGFIIEHYGADHWVDGGLMFLLTKNIQLDIAGGYELTAHNNYHQYFETVGVSFKI